ncbi:PGA30 Cell wall protein PGA30 [Candida maltosa Xu316]|uniref:Putative LDG family protein n=1 Tax=Candida maltosa (strain Xu316) TaxID=1245528 RepID=M3J4S2_CANMX|nr:putative LDG family protein [Candida maltosa Xu316]
MKFSTSIAAILSLTSTAFGALTQYRLVAESDNKDIDGKGLTFLHEGAGINYAFLSDTGVTVTYDDKTKLLYYPVSPQLQFNFGVEGNIVQFSVTPPAAVEIGTDGTVSFTGSDSVHAAKDINDPYQYSKGSFAVITEDKDGAIPFKISAIRADIQN